MGALEIQREGLYIRLEFGKFGLEGGSAIAAQSVGGIVARKLCLLLLTTIVLFWSHNWESLPDFRCSGKPASIFICCERSGRFWVRDSCEVDAQSWGGVASGKQLFRARRIGAILGLGL